MSYILALLCTLILATGTPLLDVGPPASQHDHRDYLLADPEPLGQTSLHYTVRGFASDFSDRIVGQLRRSLLYAPSDQFGTQPKGMTVAARDPFGVVHQSVDHSALAGSILAVVFDRSEPEMRGIAARRVIAVVKDVLAWWNRAMRQFPGNAMAVLQAAVDGEFAVALRDPRTDERPTSVGATGSIQPMSHPFAGRNGEQTSHAIAGSDTGHAFMVSRRTGLASWFAASGDQGAVPWWKAGQDPVWASVCAFPDGKAACVTVLLTGFCQCLVGTNRERVVDLSLPAFRQLADPSVGLIKVTMELTDSGPGLPATDSEPVQ